MNNYLTIVVPIYNEEQTLPSFIPQLLSFCEEKKISLILVNDGSTDGSKNLISAYSAYSNVEELNHRENKGYGESVKTGIKSVKTEYLMTVDADGQHSLENIEILISFFENSKEDLDLIIGERTNEYSINMIRTPGKWVLKKIAEFLVMKKIPDLNSGIRIIKKDFIMKYMHILPSGYSLSTTSTLCAISRGHNITFVPIKINKRVGGKSQVKPKTAYDTFILLLRIINLFNPLRIYLPISLIFLIFGIIWGVKYILVGDGLSAAALFSLFSSALILGVGMLSDQISQMRLEKFE